MRLPYIATVLLLQCSALLWLGAALGQEAGGAAKSDAAAAAGGAAAGTVKAKPPKAKPSPSSAGFWDPYVLTAKTNLLTLFGYPSSSTSSTEGGKSAGAATTPRPKSEITSAEVQERVKLARDLITEKRVDDAIDVLLSVMERFPEEADSREANMLLGTALLTEKQLPAAATGFLFNAVTQSNWTDTVSIANLVAALTLDNDTQLAERVAERGISVGQGQQPPVVNTVFYLGQALARLLETKGEYSRAAEWYLSAALDNPSGSDVPWIHASTMKFPAGHQNLSAAESVLLQAFPVHPNSVDILFLLASVLHRLDRIAQALPIYRRAAQLDNSRRDLMAMYATALHASNKFSEAIEAYSKAMELSGTDHNPVLLANFAMCLCEPSIANYQTGRRLVIAARAFAGGAVSDDIQTAHEMCGGEELPEAQGGVAGQPEAAEAATTVTATATATATAVAAEGEGEGERKGEKAIEQEVVATP